MEKGNINEKIKLLTGSGMWHTQEAEGLPSVHLSDGPHGQRPGLFLGRDRGRAPGKGGCEGSLERGRFRAAGAGHQHEAFPAVRQKF